ncbi:hypothetical protein G9A89_011632 [Geosiphon pyriformis]|nr:hypothetical protein G9A89_011632 [Geosiphon pyriformis]
MTKSSTPSPSSNNGWHDFVAGSFAGMAQVAIGQPLDTIKVRLQIENSRFKGPMDCFFQTLKNEGFFALYKGMASPLVGIGAVNALLFATYSRFKSIQTIDPSNNQLSLSKIAIAGAGAGKPYISKHICANELIYLWVKGVVNSILASPVELLKIKMQAQYGSVKTGPTAKDVLLYKGPIDCAQKLLQEHGIRNGLFRGFWATVFREIPGYAGFYSGFEFAKRKLTLYGSNPDNLPPSRLMAAGAFGGVCYWLCCYPLDVVKSKIQNQTNPPKGSFYVFNTLASIYRNEGWKALTRGITPTLINATAQKI